MPGEKSEPPTPKRLQEARKKGQIFKSNDLTQALLFLTAAAVLSGAGGGYVVELRQMMKEFFQPAMLTGQIAQEAILQRIGTAWARFLLLSAPLLGALFVASAAANFLQVKVLFAPDILKPKLDKLNPLKGFQNIFLKSRTYLEAIKNLIKFIVIFWLVYNSIRSSWRDIVLTCRVTLVQTAMVASKLMFNLLFKVGAVFLVIGAADYMLQKKQYMKGMMMSKQDIEQEYKQEEGDPHVKHQRKHIQEEMMAESMVEHVPKADVVVVNPTHVAVAVKYDDRVMAAPKITAKGQETMAQRIIELAKTSGVPVMRNVGLARSLFELEVGREIPEDLYEAVAEVLNWVYQLAQASAK